MSGKPIACHKCKDAWSFEPPMGRRDECPRCQSDARVCLNCVFYDSGSYRECREEQADWVKEKSTGNFCSYFTASASPRGSGSADEVARSKLDQLFGGAKPQSEESKPGASMAEQLAKFLDAKK